MLSSRSVPRLLQQQPSRRGDVQQQQSGSSDFQPLAAQPGRQEQMGEGHEEAARDYQRRIGEYLKQAGGREHAGA